MKNSVMFITVVNQSAVSLPTVRMKNGAALKDLPLNNRHPMLFGTVRNNRYKYLSALFEQTENGGFPAAPRPLFPRIRFAPK
jgi:hypothetical protein